MNDPIQTQTRDSLVGHTGAEQISATPVRSRRRKYLLIMAALILLGAFAAAAVYELRTSNLQSRYLTRLARGAT
ncbi:MAG: hypothetical protein ACK5Y6_09435, partial [Pseudomonadota bacterium]